LEKSDNPDNCLTAAWSVVHSGHGSPSQTYNTLIVTQHAIDNAKAKAETIEALYELSCWDFTAGEVPHALTGPAANVLSDLDWDAETGTPETLQEAITDYANAMPLSVLLRSGWHSPGETFESAEFEILLSTGGPACRIVGELDRGEVAWQAGCRPTIQHQDWGTPWTDSPYNVDINALQWFCEQFYYGE
jgi:hypothetical protein